MFICAASDIHGAMNRLYDALKSAFELRPNDIEAPTATLKEEEVA